MAQPLVRLPVQPTVSLAAPPTLTLCLTLARLEDVDLSRFRVYRSRVLELLGWQVGLHVIGASSLVLLERPGVALAEILTCGPAELPLNPLASGVLAITGQGEAAIEATGPGWRYRSRLWTASLDAEQPEKGAAVVVEHVFPGPGEPRTRIEAGTEGGALHLRTRHDYPECATGVWSESRLAYLPKT